MYYVPIYNLKLRIDFRLILHNTHAQCSILATYLLIIVKIPCNVDEIVHYSALLNIIGVHIQK